jgi:hypothetical protein
VHDVEPIGELEKLRRKLRRLPGSGRRIAVLPGVFFTSAISSFTLVAGIDGLTLNT